MPKTSLGRTRFFLTLLATVCFGSVCAQTTIVAEQKHRSRPVQTLSSLYSKQLPSAMQDRLEYFSRALLGQPYLLGALGEGKHGQYDTSPLYRFDGFDCETFVDTVLALALSDNANTFRQCMKHIRYDQGVVDFTTRNHFASLDWNPHNQSQGFIKDITKTLHNEKHQPVYKIASTVIDKMSWYQKLPAGRLKLTTKPPAVVRNKLHALHQEGKRFKPVVATLPYIPLTALFKQNGQANIALFRQIPNGAIIEIVRPNWDLTAQIGTHLNVSHLGFIFWRGKQVVFREASAIYGKTIDVDFIAYLQEYLDSPTIKGINIQVVLPPTPVSRACTPTRAQNKSR